MRWKEINEAPISDFNTFGDMSQEGSFRSSDLKAITNPKWVEKVHHYLKNIPQDVNLYFYNDIDPNSQYRENVDANGGFKAWSQALKFIGGKMPPNYKTAITIILLENEGDGRISLTPWIVAHRMAHAILSKNTRGDENLDGLARNFTSISNNFLGTLSNVLDKSPKYKHLNLDAYDAVGSVQLVGQLCKFKSAKSGAIDRPGEIYVEWMAQYLVQGSITLYRPELDDAGRYQKPEMSPEEEALVSRAKEWTIVTYGRVPHPLEIEQAANHFARNVLTKSNKLNKDGSRRDLTATLLEPQPFYNGYDKDGKLVAQASKSANVENMEARGLRVELVQPTPQMMASYKKNMDRLDQISDMYVKWADMGILSQYYPAAMHTLTDKADKIIDSYEASVNAVCAKILEACVGKVAVL
jgi:hypothetical protein